MIGSQTKAQRFIQRLSAKGISQSQLQNFHSPIGDTSVPGKRPIEVAVSISSQLIKQLHEPNITTPLDQLTNKDTHDA